MSYGAIGGSASISAGAAVPRALQVWEATGALEYQVEALSEAVKALAIKLQPLLSPANDISKAGESPAYSCELAARIDSSSERLRQFRAIADDLLSRLEI